MNLLIRGPAASGKSRAALERFHAVPGSWLIVPSATMAEHMRHQLAREGVAVRPRSIQTLGQFVDAMTPLAEVPAPLLTLVVAQALERLRVPQWSAVEGQPGFHRALAELVEEAPLAGLPGDWGRLLAEVDQSLAARSIGRRNVRLEDARMKGEPACAQIVMDGFFSFSAGELNLILALAQRVPVTVTLPDSPQSHAAANRLAARFSQTRDVETKRWRTPVVSQFSAATVEHEAAEIARRIRQEVQRGRPLREMAVVLRAREPYAPVLETTLARCGIPAHFYFSDPLGSHPAMAFLSTVVRAMLRGWDHESLLSALRMPVSGGGATPGGDRLDFEWRERLPAFGLPRGDEPLFAALASLDPLRREVLTAAEWAGRLRGLRRLVAAIKPADQVSREQITAWRSTVSALAAFDRALDAAALALHDAGRLALAVFWPQVESVLALEPLRVADRRRDVVHVMDVFEARQWEAPLVFVCGLIERHFPQYHREDALLGDAERRRLGLDTAAERQQQERFLFDLAITRATERVVLSYPRFDERGEETLPSFFLPSGGAVEALEEQSEPPNAPAIAKTPRIVSGDLLEQLAAKHSTLSPSSVGTFRQCRFQFFAARTLRLRERPTVPRDRLDIRLQGSIIHRALAEYAGAPLLGAALFAQVFDEECRAARVSESYRTEAVRLEMLRNFEGFLADRSLSLAGWNTQVEQSFKYKLHGGLTIRGRIDRIETTGRRALVIDYKYSIANRIRDQVEKSAEGDQVQAGLYLGAAERAFGFVPIGMLFCGLKKEILWDGWHTAIAGLREAGAECSPEFLRDLVRAAENTASEAHEAILSGRIDPAPADPKLCLHCDFRDICRVESAGFVVTEKTA